MYFALLTTACHTYDESLATKHGPTARSGAKVKRDVYATYFEDDEDSEDYEDYLADTYYGPDDDDGFDISTDVSEIQAYAANSRRSTPSGSPRAVRMEYSMFIGGPPRNLRAPVG